MHFLHKFSQTQAQQGFQQSDTRNKIRCSGNKKSQKTGTFYLYPLFSVCQIYVFITNLNTVLSIFVKLSVFFRIKNWTLAKRY